MKYRIAVLSCLLLIASALTAADLKGSIRGLVIDEAGNPIPLAQVMARDTEPAPPGVVEVQMGALPWVETDDQGRFVIKGLIAGHRYKVYAKKEEDGYADPNIPTYNPTDEGVVTVTQNMPRSSPDVRIQLGPKAVVFTYNLRDAVTGKRVKDYTITVTRLDTDYTFGGSESDNRILLPADTDMRIVFEVKGYQTWYYPGRNTKEEAEPLRDASGEVKHVTVFLQPEVARP